MVLADSHYTFFNAGKRGEDRLDFSQFNAIAADLHLVITTAEKFELTIPPEASDIAGSINAFGTAIWQRDHRKLFGRQFGSLPVTSGDTFTANAKFAGHPDGR